MWELWLVTITSRYLTTTASGTVLQVLGGVATVLNIGGWLVVSNHPKIYVCQLESSSRRPVKLQQPCLDFFGNLNLLFNTLPLSPISNNYPPLQAPQKKLRDRWPQSQAFSLVGGGVVWKKLEREGIKWYILWMEEILHQMVDASSHENQIVYSVS